MNLSCNCLTNVHVSSMNKQQLDTLRVVVDDCQMERCVALSVRYVLCPPAWHNTHRQTDNTKPHWHITAYCVTTWE